MAAAAPKPSDLQLSRPEQIMVQGLIHRDAAIRTALQEVLHEKLEVFAMIESRLGLQAGAIGTAYDIDLKDWRLSPLDQPEPQSPRPEAAPKSRRKRDQPT